ncbi:gluconokinase [Lyngbya confervoides]|uniref:Gluconokinase n=1 Tax=Lyngbya confervoides BDU141951 TaxID=1574623 RepID=A0ABD4T1C0_9CYAN|nr:gluconokinase [Lyngbya confervoides]MCM1982428.1 gluconokinase [Lyngbya confervoides BDU141951]
MTIVMIMGVSGSGKTTVGQALARQLHWPFVDADQFHSPQNIAKMRRGQPLTDADRQPWLADLRAAVISWHRHRASVVLACSALKASYRQQISPEGVPIQWVYLQGSYSQIQRRLEQRQVLCPTHFMGPQLLQSQLDSLEEPEEALFLSITLPVEEMVQRILRSLPQSTPVS